MDNSSNTGYTLDQSLYTLTSFKSPALTFSIGASMNKDQFAVLAEGSTSLNKTFDKIEDAKTYAKQLTQQVKGRVLVVKAVYAVSPKVDVEEEDL